MGITPFDGLVQYVSNHSTVAQQAVPTWHQWCAANNMVHAAAMSSQVLVNWVPLDDDSGVTLPGDGGGDPDRLDYPRIWGRIPIRIHDTRGPFRLRVRLAAYETGGDAQTLRLVITPREYLEEDRFDEDRPNVADFTVPASGSEPAWIDASPKYISFDDSDPRVAHVEETIVTDVEGSGIPSSADIATRRIRWAPMTVSVWNASDDPSVTCKLSGLYVAEYVGP